MALEPETALPAANSALQLHIEARLDVALLTDLAQAARSQPDLPPLIKLAMDTLGGKPLFKAHAGRLEAWSQVGAKLMLWSLEPLESTQFRGAAPTDLIFRQRGVPGTALQLLRAVPDLRILETEGLLKWPKVIALTKAVYWDKIGEKLPSSLQKWWRSGSLQSANLIAEDDHLAFEFRAGWSQIEPVFDFLLTPPTSEVASETASESTLKNLVDAQISDGFPALRGTKFEVQIVVEQALANRVVSAILAQLQAIPAEIVAPEAAEIEIGAAASSGFRIVSFIRDLQVSFEDGHATIRPVGQI